MSERQPTKFEEPNRTYLLPLDGKPSGARPDPPKVKKKRGKLVGTIALGTLLTLGLAAVLAIVLLPGCIKQKCIEAAADRGVTLTIDDVSLGTDHFTLRGVRATLAEFPGATAAAKEARVDLSGLMPELVTVKDTEVLFEGPYDVAKASYAKWRAAHKGAGTAGGAGGTAPPKIVFESTRVTWLKPYGAGKVEAVELHADITPKNGGEELHVIAPRVTLTLPGGSVGPWRIDYDRTETTSRVRIGFDPQVPESPNAIFVTDHDAVTSIEVAIPRSPLARFNITPALLGLSSDAAGTTQLEAKIRYVHPTPTLVEARGDVGFYGLKLGGVGVPLDAKLGGSVKGQSDHLDIKQGELTLGQMKGALTGALKLFDGGFRIELAWKAGLMECATFFTPPAPPPGTNPGLDLTRGLQQLAQATGVAKVTGNIKIDASLVFDTRDFGQAKVTFVPEHTCNLSLFGSH